MLYYVLIFAGTGGDRMETGWGRVGMEMKSVGMGADECNFHPHAGL